MMKTATVRRKYDSGGRFMQRSISLFPSAAVEQVRASASVRVGRTSLRAVAREIGMSPSGLKKFLRGASPYSPTVRRLQRWYVQHANAGGGDLRYTDAAAALAVLTHDLGAQALAGTVQ